MNAMVDGKVEPKVVYQPNLVVTTWFKTWAIQCGNCEKDFVRFAIFGKPRCPFCKVVNAPKFMYSY